MESNKIKSIFENYLIKENTNYALLISGKWGSGKTFLWKNILVKKAVEKNFKPVYISLNGIENIKDIENILFSRILPYSDKFQSKGVKNTINFLKNLANVTGKVFARGTQLIDLTKGIKINLDVSQIVFCFDDLERCSVPPENILGLINEYTEHKNAKVIICSAEEEISNETSYNRIKEKVIGRVLNYSANYDELFNSYLGNLSDKGFKQFLVNKKKLIIHFFKKHNIQNLRTFGFCLENIERLFEFFKDETQMTIDSMLFFIAIISNEFKTGELTIANLKDKKGIDHFFLYIDIDDVVDNMMGTPIVQTKTKEIKEKTYNQRFSEKYLSDQNEKDMYLFSEAIYEFILSGYLDTEKLKSEIDTRNGKNSDTEEQKVYNTLMGYNFRILENDELETSINQVLNFAKEGKYNIYSYQSIYHNLSYHIEIDSLDLKDETLISDLIKGLDKSISTSDINNSQMSNITHFKNIKDFNPVEKKIFELHNTKRGKQKSESANKIFKIIDKELVEVNDFITEELRYDNSLFEFIDAKIFFEKLNDLKNKNVLVFSNALKDLYYKKGYVKFPEKELPFFEVLNELLNEYYNSNDLKNPKKIITKELIERIDEIINHFKERIDQKNR